jgi:hypothetical protein
MGLGELLIPISVPLIQVGPPGYFIHVPITTPIVSALKNYYISSFLEAPAGILKNFWIQVVVLLLKPPHGGFRSETAVTKPFRNWNGYKFITAILCNGHSPTDTSSRSGVTVM